MGVALLEQLRASVKNACGTDFLPVVHVHCALCTWGRKFVPMFLAVSWTPCTSCHHKTRSNNSICHVRTDLPWTAPEPPALVDLSLASSVWRIRREQCRIEPFYDINTPCLTYPMLCFCLNTETSCFLMKTKHVQFTITDWIFQLLSHCDSNSTVIVQYHKKSCL